MIPFNKPVWLGTELNRITQAITEHGHVAGNGPFGARCENQLGELLGRPALLVSSCTHALEMAAMLLDVGPGDEVIVPSFTFVSSANAFVLRGAKPVFADVDRTGNLDPAEVARLRTARTRAVVTVHYAGNSCDLRALAEASSGLPIVEDAAQALGARFAGSPLGTLGALGTFSFHETKNIGCGEGGALCVNDPALLERAHVLRDKGTNRRRFLHGLVDKYTWVDLGSSYSLSDLNAAYLSAQLDAREEIQGKRGALYQRYMEALTPHVERKGGFFVAPHADNMPNHHLVGLVFERGAQRDRFIAAMRTHGITAPFHYVALHQSAMGERFHDGRALPWSERLTQCLVRLPLYFNLSTAEQDEVIARAQEILDGL